MKFALARQHPFTKNCNRPILLKKSTMVSAAEKYASEIEIFTFGRGFGAQISRSTVQKRRFNQSMTRLFGRTDFFNRIDQKRLLSNWVMVNQGLHAAIYGDISMRARQPSSDYPHATDP